MSLTREPSHPARAVAPPQGISASRGRPDPTLADIEDDRWQPCGPVDRRSDDGALVLRATMAAGRGSERGVASRTPYEGVVLSFEVCIPGDATFLAKINQADALDQTTNSYHLYCDPRVAYLARHDHVFRAVPLARGAWQSIRLAHAGGVLSLHVGERLVDQVREATLPRGYAFLGVKAGEVRLRAVRLRPFGGAPEDRPGEAASVENAATAPPPGAPEAVALHAPGDRLAPRVSIVTTVYDRVDCLRRCLRSVKALAWRDYEHIVVSDGPDAAVVDAITGLVRAEDDGRLSYFNLTRRFNNWGIASAAAGLARARGELVCFLSDDNGYLPDHFDPLVAALDHDPRLGFAYSSCLYGGRLVLRHPVPGPGRIDLGQPLFRRELFARHLGGGLPFDVIAWDWALVEALMRRGVRFKHVDRATFVFRLASYPRLAAGLA